MILHYLTLALRRLRQTPMLALLMVVTLAVGLAAGMTTNALRYALARDPMPGKSARLLSIANTTGPIGLESFSYADAAALGNTGAPYGAFALTGWGEMPIDIPGVPDHTSRTGTLRFATAHFFAMFDVPITQGRIWTAAEAHSATPVVVVNAQFANKLFGDVNAVGKHIRIGNTLYSVIGITGAWNPRPRFYNLRMAASVWGSGPDLFAPLTTIQYAPAGAYVSFGYPSNNAPPNARLLSCAQCTWLDVWYLARNPREAKLLARAVTAQLPQVVPAGHGVNLGLLNVRQILAKANLVPASVRVYAVLGVAFLALCILNAAGMQLSRVLRARAQIGIRRALGAKRADIIRQYLLDALFVGGIGGCLGIGLTFVALAAVRRYLETFYADMARLDGMALGILIALVVVCAVVVGVIPAWLASRADPARVIKAAQ